MFHSFGPATLPRAIDVHGVPAILRDLILMALGAGLLILASKIQIPLAPYPITMQTAAVLFLGATYGMRLSGMTVGFWILLGVLGLNVFADPGGIYAGLVTMGAEAGRNYMFGTFFGAQTAILSAGFVWGFIPMAMIVGWAVQSGIARSPFQLTLAMLVANILLYVPGLIWVDYFMADMSFGWAFLGIFVGPYILTDLLKLAFAQVLAHHTHQAIMRFRGDD